MTTTAQSLKQHITNKARSDKFLLVLTIPPVLKNENVPILSARTQDFVQENALQFSVWGIVVPSVRVNNHEIRFAGQPYNVTTQSRDAYAPIQLNFTIDNYYNNYWLLWRWLDKINKIKTSGMDGHFSDEIVENNVGVLGNKYTDYQTMLTIYGLDEYNTKVVRFDYTNSFITELGDIRYNYRNEQELECNFTFVFNQMHITLLENNVIAQ